MEARSLEFACYRFHLGLKRRHKVGFHWNLGKDEYLGAWWHLVAYTIEAVLTEYHFKRLPKGLQLRLRKGDQR